ncbi:MAG: choice-of-anchor J domain-containing protein, partial [Fibrella sp.]|nr:choice-of-anchor J domain-containing protein [Armatimonadota bacterium]
MFHSLRHLRNLSAAVAVVGLSALISATPVSAEVVLTEGFENIVSLAPQGWVLQNNSIPAGPTGWFQGNPAVFPAQAGPTNSYIGANFNNTTGVNTISNWAITPTFSYDNGDTFQFFTRTASPVLFPDRLEVRLSTNGSSANVGSTATSVGDFSTLLLSVNPGLTLAGYPTGWTSFTATISGLAAATNGRIAFRYFVENGGDGANSSFIGIDSLVIDAAPATILPPPPPTPPDSTEVGVPSSIAATLAGANEVDWYSFINPGGTITINTLGSTLGTGDPFDND